MRTSILRCALAASLLLPSLAIENANAENARTPLHLSTARSAETVQATPVGLLGRIIAKRREAAENEEHSHNDRHAPDVVNAIIPRPVPDTAINRTANRDDRTSATSINPANRRASDAASESSSRRSRTSANANTTIDDRAARAVRERFDEPTREAESDTSPSDNDSPELTPELLELRDKVQECLVHYYRQHEYAGNRSPWGIMHSLIAYGVDTEIYAGDRKVNAIGWLCWNGAGRGQRLFYTVDGQLQARQGPGVQGHPGQFLAMLAQSKVKPEYPIKADGYEFTIHDLIEYEKQTCYARSELTFKLIALSYYLPSDAKWKNERDEDWDIPRLIEEELAQSVVDGACGGTHRMMGFSYAVRMREKRGEEMIGQWARAKKFIEDYHEYTFKLQNPDGSMSTSVFNGRGDWGGAEKRLETSGHVLEWLAFSLTDEQLREPRMIKGIDYLATLMLENKDFNWEIGPKGHALHALAIYDQRVFGTKIGTGGPRIESALTKADAE